MRRVPLTMVVAATALAVAPALAAAAPTPIGSGDKPWVHVDRQGTTHVSWVRHVSPLQDELHYRRRPAGATAFGPDTVLPGALGTDFVGPQILQDPAPSNRLVIVASRSGVLDPLTYAISSIDSGVTWSAPSLIYELTPAVNPTNGRVATAAFASGALQLINGNPTIRQVTTPADLSAVAPQTSEVPISPAAYDGSVVRDPAGNPVIAFGDLERTFIRRGTAGADQLVGNYPNIGNSTIKIAGGARGVAAVVVGGVPGILRNFLIARKLTDSGLTASVRLTVPADDDPDVPFLTADPVGRFHVVWRSGEDTLLYRRSEHGTAWRPTVQLHKGGGIWDPVASAGADGRGWVVWQRTFTSANGPIVATPLDDFGIPDTSGIKDPLVTRQVRSVFVTPKKPGLAAVRRRKCVNVRVQTIQPARIRVAIFSGKQSVRVFGARVVRFTTPGKRLVCIKVPLNASTFDVRKQFRFAFAVKPGAKPKRGEKPGKLSVTGFTRFR